MSVRATQCVVLTCDDCGQDDELPDGGIEHYDDAQHARTNAGECGWTFEGGKDRCEPCSARHACAVNGHVPDLATRGEFCDRCEEKL